MNRDILLDGCDSFTMVSHVVISCVGKGLLVILAEVKRIWHSIGASSGGNISAIFPPV